MTDKTYNRVPDVSYLLIINSTPLMYFKCSHGYLFQSNIVSVCIVKIYIFTVETIESKMLPSQLTDDMSEKYSNIV